MLAARKARWFCSGEFLHADHRERISHAHCYFGFRCVRGMKAICHVFADVEVGKKSVMLKDSIDAAFVGRKCIEARAVHPDFSCSGLFESGDKPQQSGFAGTAFPEKRQEFACDDFQRKGF